MKKYLSIFLICFLLFGVSVPAFASTDSIVPPNLDPTQYDSYIISYDDSKGGKYHCTLFLASDYDVYFYKGSHLVQLFPKSDLAHVVYSTSVLASDYDSSAYNNGWGTLNQSASGTFDNNVTGEKKRYINHGSNFSENDYIIVSTVDIPNATWYSDLGAFEFDGEFFFQLTPPLVLATEEALSLFQSQTFQTIATIVLCGVGCLALLIGLSLLRKVLPRFLNR